EAEGALARRARGASRILADPDLERAERLAVLRLPGRLALQGERLPAEPALQVPPEPAPAGDPGVLRLGLGLGDPDPAPLAELGLARPLSRGARHADADLLLPRHLLAPGAGTLAGPRLRHGPHPLLRGRPARRRRGPSPAPGLARPPRGGLPDSSDRRRGDSSEGSDGLDSARGGGRD